MPIYSPSSAITGHTDADGFRAIGLPMLLMGVLGCICFLFYNLTREWALQWSRLGPIRSFVFYSSVLQGLLSLLMFFSAAWNYAMVNMFVSLFVILALLMKDAQVTKYGFWALLALNIILLAGTPCASMSTGILSAIRDGCFVWYQTYSDTMCVTGWLAALQFFATLTIAAQFANAFVFATFLLDTSSLTTGIAARDGQYETIDGAKPHPAAGAVATAGVAGYQGGQWAQ
jgi:hypothetical protein